MAGRGDTCYFPRDLGRGSYGGDVHCFQQFLSNKGYLLEEPTGYFGERTATASKRWQVRLFARTGRERACHLQNRIPFSPLACDGISRLNIF
jgi:hypothetical protein